MIKRKKGFDPKAITIVDDDPTLGEALVKQFSSLGYKVERINNGIDAIAKMNEKPSGLILVKLGLKDFSGDLVAFYLNYTPRTNNISVFLYEAKAKNFSQDAINKIKRRSGARDLILFDDSFEIIERIDEAIRNEPEFGSEVLDPTRN